MFGTSAIAPPTTFWIHPPTVSKAVSLSCGRVSTAGLLTAEERSSSSACWISASVYPSSISVLISSSESHSSALAVSNNADLSGFEVGTFFLRKVFDTSASTSAFGRA